LPRAGVWISGSASNGQTWAPGLLVTERNTFSHRYPCIIDRMVGSPSDDTVCVLYLMDSIAGSFVMGDGPASPNPVICQFIPSTYVGVAESPKPQASSFKPPVTVIRGVLFLPSSLLTANSSLLSTDGRKVLDLHPGENDVSRLPPGVYFVRDVQGQGVAKVVIAR
ncbi:hypothetical protein JXD38_07995, partial [candidate division WOR-3 bacterium]|nr:hypothetical protein [candidate division WOR-3 bacterium]